MKHLGVDVGVGYFDFIDTDMVRGADAHPVLGNLRDEALRPAQQDLPAVDGRQGDRRRHRGPKRWVVVPPWARAMIVARTVFRR